MNALRVSVITNAARISHELAAGPRCLVSTVETRPTHEPLEVRLGLIEDRKPTVKTLPA